MSCISYLYRRIFQEFATLKPWPLKVLKTDLKSQMFLSLNSLEYKCNYFSKGLSKKAMLKQKPTFSLSALIPTYGTETVNLKL